MRIPAEALKYLSMHMLIRERTSVTEPFEKREALTVHGEGFAMHIRQVKERATFSIYPEVIACCYGVTRERKRLLVGGERSRRSAEQVSRELIEHEYLSQPSVWRRSPLRPYACKRVLMRGEKTFTNERIERVILCKPSFRPALFEPEMEYVSRGHEK